MSGPWDVVEIANEHGIRARLSSYGARLLELWTPDRAGRFDDVVLGLPTLEAYQAARSLYLGCTVGRVANRIRGAQFTLDGTTYRLTANEPPNHLHGGADGSFDNLFWSIDRPAVPHAVTFRVTSEHLAEGYPGVLRVAVTYSLTDHDELVIDYLAEPDRRTPISLTHHSYWNLEGHRSLGNILDHELWVPASTYTPLAVDLVPTGRIAPVERTLFDFRRPTRIGSRIAALERGPARGFDHNLVLDKSPEAGAAPQLAARLREPGSGRVLELSTTTPGLQVYSGQMLPTTVGKHGTTYRPLAGMALEPQGVPNAVNEPGFPSVVVDPDRPYRQRSIYRFLVDG